MNEVNSKLAGWLNQVNLLTASLVAAGYKPTAIGARDALANVTRLLVKTSTPLAWVNEEIIAGESYDVPVRIYHPSPSEARPVMVFYHGGGHMAGSVSVYDPICRRLAASTGYIVVSAEYRLAPENPYPAGVDDAITVAKGVWQALDDRHVPYIRELTVAGDSAGGALASTVAGRSQAHPEWQIKNQLLFYPSLDYTMSFPSIDENGEGYFLQKSRIDWYFKNYFRAGGNPEQASSLYGPFTANLPRTLIVTAGFDPLRDEGLAYVEKARAAGVEVIHLHFDDLIHAFLNMEDLIPEECDKVYVAINTFLNG